MTINEPQPARVVVCIATCRRPDHLRRTIESVLAQEFTHGPVPLLQVQVVENDEAAQGRAVVEELARNARFPVEYAVEPRRGISFARNRLVERAGDCEFVAFIDDDEVACSQWLDELLVVAHATGADAVLGAVVPAFTKIPPPWLRQFFERPTEENAAIVNASSFRTGNVLLRAQVLRQIRGPFDVRFGLTGGSDTLLGEQLQLAGCRFAWAAHADVFESVPESRVTARWVARRRFRSGMVHVMAQQVTRGVISGGVRGVYRGLGTIAVYGPKVVSSALYRDQVQLASSAGQVVYGVGNLCGAVGVRFQEYKRIHSV